MQRALPLFLTGLWLGCGGSGTKIVNDGAETAGSAGGGGMMNGGTASSGAGADSGSGSSASGSGGSSSNSSGSGGGPGAAASVPFVYVGGRAGIFVFRLNETDGSLSAVEGPLDADMNPSFHAVDPAHRVLYAVNELGEVDGEKSGAVSAFRIDQEDGKLTFLNRVSSKGQGPAHLSTDRSGRFVLVANYGGGTAAVLPIGPGGELGPSVFEVGFGPESKAHHIVTDPANRFAFVTNLGLDAVASSPLTWARASWRRATRPRSRSTRARPPGTSISTRTAGLLT